MKNWINLYIGMGGPVMENQENRETGQQENGINIAGYSLLRFTYTGPCKRCSGRVEESYIQVVIQIVSLSCCWE